VESLRHRDCVVTELEDCWRGGTLEGSASAATEADGVNPPNNATDSAMADMRKMIKGSASPVTRGPGLDELNE